MVLAQEAGRDPCRDQARIGVANDAPGGWVIFSQERQVNFSRTVLITFH